MNRLLLLMLALCLFFSQAEAGVTKTHGFSLTDGLKYGADFRHFEFVNPKAPKGGTLRRAMYGTYDSFNPFAPKGISIKATGYLHDSLMTSSADESLSYYGLIAETMEYPDDYSWVIFNLRPEAKWSDGTSLTADDVVFSFEKITEASPFYRNYYNLITKAEALGKHRVKFHFAKEETSRELPLIAGQLSIIPKHFWQTRDLSKSSLEIPPVSGAYRIISYEVGKRVTFGRVRDYWGEKLPVNVGQNNFDTIVFEYFRDQTVAFEAFKAGHFDFTAESSGRRWYRGYTGKYFDMGLIRKEEIPHKNPQGMKGIVFNTALKPLDNILVRKALNYAYDYDWINKNIYFDQDKRHDSFFSNSELACGAVPAADVAAVIKQVKPDAGDELLRAQFRFPSTDGSGNNRENLKTAVQLFEQAGYRIVNGKMTGKDGKPLYLEITTSSKTIEKELMTFKKALERIGIDFYIRYMDSTQFVDKVRAKDYMMIYTAVKQSESPGNEQRNMWHSEAADEAGSRNYSRIKDPAVDRLVDMIINAKDRKSLVTYSKALDRVLLNGWYFIPSGYSDRYRIAYWDKFGKPEKMPEYSFGFGSWWIEPEKEKKIDSLIKR
ncbi:MAG: extracellular solute-binding protein [Geovibrio sp.]|nr:extracellular solute-binding protein [Geovibrio sp.]